MVKGASRIDKLQASGWGFLPVAAAFMLVLILVSPQGEFPLNDDWIYSSAVQEHSADEMRLVERHTSAYFFPQRLYGRALVNQFGFSFVLLRTTGIFAAFLCLFLTYRILRKLGFRAFTCLAGTSVLLANPIFLNLSYTFMTDLPYLAFLLAALLGYLNVAQSRHRGWLALATFFTILAATQRQTGILICPAALLYFFSRRKERPLAIADWGLLLAQIPIFILLSFFIHPQGVDTEALSKLLNPFQWAALYNLKPLPAFSAIAGVNNAELYGIVILSLITYLGLFVLPLLLGGLLRRRGTTVKLPPRFFLISLAALGVLWGLKRLLEGARVGPLQAQSMPFLANVLHRCGVGPAEHDAIVGECVSIFSPLFWNVLTFAALLGGAMLLSLILLQAGEKLGSISWRKLADLPGEPSPSGVAPAGSGLVLLTGLTQMVPFFLIWPQDRYLLPLIVPAVVVTLEAFRHRGLSKALPTILLVAFLAYSVAGLHDYFSWNRLRWNLARQLVAQGVSPEKIEGGLEWVAWYSHDKPSALTRVKEVSPYLGWYTRWAPSLDPEYLISFSEVPGYEVLHTRDWSHWLPRTSAHIYVSRRIER